jgi:hypothetical protein
MTVFDKVSDDIYIARLRKSLGSRKILAYIYVLVGVIVLGASIYYGMSIYDEMVKYVAHLNAEDARNLSKADLSEMSVKSNFYFGIGIGVTLMAAASSGAALVVNACVLLFGGRKEKMLIRYYDQSTRAGT